MTELDALLPVHGTRTMKEQETDHSVIKTIVYYTFVNLLRLGLKYSIFLYVFNSAQDTPPLKRINSKCRENAAQLRKENTTGYRTPLSSQKSTDV